MHLFSFLHWVSQSPFSCTDTYRNTNLQIGWKYFSMYIKYIGTTLLLPLSKTSTLWQLLVLLNPIVLDPEPQAWSPAAAWLIRDLQRFQRQLQKSSDTSSLFMPIIIKGTSVVTLRPEAWQPEAPADIYSHPDALQWADCTDSGLQNCA